MSVLPFPQSETSVFFDAVLGDVPEGNAILIWSLPAKRSIWCSTAVAAAVAAEKIRDREDCYVGVGLRRAGLDATKRGGDDEVTALSGLVADFDLAGPGHTKTNLPRDRAEVQKLLDRLALQPSLIVQTGGGIHCWWLFTEPWVLDSDAERQRARALSRGWAGRIKSIARDHRLDVDAVHDLARVLRVPGTFNLKGGNRRDVQIESLTSQRFQPSDFEEWAVEILESIKLGLGGLLLREDAIPPFILFEALRDNEPKFRMAWERRRKDLQDQSASSYDYSLANYAIAAGWDDQEIVDLLIAWRRKHGESLKLREDYYARTIGKIRAELATRTATKELEAELSPPATGGGSAQDLETSREKAIAVLRAYTGLSVERIVRNGEVEGHYVVVLADGRQIEMGGLKELRSYQTWWDRAFELTKAAPEVGPKALEWRKALAHAQSLVEELHTDDTSELSFVRGWLRDYTSAKVRFTGLDVEQRVEILKSGQVFEEEGEVHFQLGKFSDWLALKRVSISAKRLSHQLRELGFVPKKVGVCVSPEKVVTRDCWRGKAPE